MNKLKKFLLVAGARPNFMKIAPLIRALNKLKKSKNILIHTGQHYDEKMSKVFFRDLNIPRPEIDLGVGGGTHAAQTGQIMMEFDKVLEKFAPDLVIVVGDVNSTIACALTAKKRGIKIAHVEAGLRSFDNEMPEEINRILTDRISDYLFCTEPQAVANLKHEGIDNKKIFLTGNVMIDTLMAHKKSAEKSKILEIVGVKNEKYALATLHRPSNVDDKESLKKLLEILQKVDEMGLTVIFPVHPRTRKNMENLNLDTKGITMIDPVGYLDFLKLMSNATVVMTDSGGIQEETTILGVPCLTLRQNTERPITVSEGTNQIVGNDSGKIIKAVKKIIASARVNKPKIKFWDGKAGERIARILVS